MSEDNIQEELKISESEMQAIEIDYQRRYGRYDVEDFRDLIVWSHEFEPRNPQRMDEVERMGILIRLLHIKSVAAQASADTFRELYMNCNGDKGER